MALPGGVQITGFISPTSSGDTYATHDAFYGRDGLRNVEDINDLNIISSDRRRSGMIVGVGGSIGNVDYYKLLPKGSGWSYTISDWEIAFLSVSATTALVSSAMTNEIYTTGSTLIGSTIFYDTTSTLSAYTTDLSSLDTFVNGMVFDNNTYDLSITKNDGTSFSQNLSILATDMRVTGGTYDINSGVVVFTNNSGGTFNVSGFTAGVTDTVITDFDLSGDTLTIKDSSSNIFNVDVSTLSNNTFVNSGVYDNSTGSVLFQNNSGGTFNVSGFTTGSTDSYTTDVILTGTTLSFKNNIYGDDFFNIDLIDLPIGASFGNTYFVTPDGDNLTGKRGDILKPFQTISGARDKAVDEINNSGVTGSTLVYVFPGEYVDNEMQYENGNFYFTAGARVSGIAYPSGGDETAMFIIGSTPKYKPQYSATTCDVFGSGDFFVPKRLDDGWNGEVLSVDGSGSTYFECNNIDVIRGIGVFVAGNGVANVRGNNFTVHEDGYAVTVRNNSDSTFDFQRISAYINWTFFIRNNFGGNCTIKSDRISSFSPPSIQVNGAITVENLRPNARVVINCPVIESANNYCAYIYLASGGEIEINGNMFGKYGISLFQNSNASVKLNGHIYSNNTGINMGSNNTIDNSFKFYMNGDININPISGVSVTNAVSLGRGTLRLNGSLNNVNDSISATTSNGINITSSGNLILDNYKIITDDESITSTSPRNIKVIHSLASNKPINNNITNLIGGSNIIIDSEVE